MMYSVGFYADRAHLEVAVLMRWRSAIDPNLPIGRATRSMHPYGRETRSGGGASIGSYYFFCSEDGVLSMNGAFLLSLANANVVLLDEPALGQLESAVDLVEVPIELARARENSEDILQLNREFRIRLREALMGTDVVREFISY
jgi:hypothetical protein